MTARSRLTALTLLLIALTATSSLEAREVLRYAPPAGEFEGVITVTLTTSDETLTLAQGAELSDGYDVRVHLTADSTQTILHAYVEITDADEIVVDSYTDSVAWSPEYIAAEVSWSDGQGGIDTAGTYFREPTGTDFQETGGAEFQESGGLDVANSGGGRVLTARVPETAGLTVTVYHPGAGEQVLMSDEDVGAGENILAGYSANYEELSLSSESLPMQTAEVVTGSIVKVQLELSSDRTVSGSFVAR